MEVLRTRQYNGEEVGVRQAVVSMRMYGDAAKAYKRSSERCRTFTKTQNYLFKRTWSPTGLGPVRLREALTV